MVIEQINSIIKNSKNILLVSHINPDGDTLGSMCGLYSLIKDNLKKNCEMVAVSDVPVTYNFLPYVDKVKHISEFDLSREYDLVITIDVAAIDRCADAEKLFKKAKNTINIDHHETNIGYAEINIIEPQAAATGEIILEIAEKLGWKISLETAINLYVAIVTDTGCFKYETTTPEVFRLAAELVELGASPNKLYKLCYETKTKNLVMFQNYCVNKAEFVYEKAPALR